MILSRQLIRSGYIIFQLQNLETDESLIYYAPARQLTTMIDLLMRRIMAVRMVDQVRFVSLNCANDSITAHKLAIGYENAQLIRQPNIDWAVERLAGTLENAARVGQGMARPVRDDTTGHVYPSSGAACAALGLTKGALSCHLRQVPGYKTVRGRTFSYVG